MVKPPKSTVFMDDILLTVLNRFNNPDNRLHTAAISAICDFRADLLELKKWSKCAREKLEGMERTVDQFESKIEKCDADDLTLITAPSLLLNEMGTLQSLSAYIERLTSNVCVRYRLALRLIESVMVEEEKKQHGS